MREDFIKQQQKVNKTKGESFFLAEGALAGDSGDSVAGHSRIVFLANFFIS